MGRHMLALLAAGLLPLLAFLPPGLAAPQGISRTSLRADGRQSRKLQQEYEVEEKIAGGSKAPCGRYPYMVSLRDRANMHKCGGVLIRKKWVATAAHCVDPNKKGTLGLRPILAIGACRLDDDVDMFLAKEAFIHPNWTGNVAEGHDIALLLLEKASSETPVGLPTSSETLSRDDTLVAIGWGEQGDASKPRDLRQAAGMHFIENDFCDSVDVWGEVILDEMLCAFGNEQDVCEGDSGGPLLQVFAPGQNISAGSPDLDIVVGITSFGEKVENCGDSKKPSVFTRLGKYYDWIDGIIKMKKNKALSSLGTKPTALSDADPVSEPGAESEGNPRGDPPAEPPTNATDLDENVIQLASAPAPSAAPELKSDSQGEQNSLEEEKEGAASNPGVVLTPEEQQKVDQELWNASSEGDVSGVEAALAGGASVDVKLGDGGSTPLWVAASGGHLPVVRLLLARGADPDTVRKSDGATALFAAVRGGFMDVVKALLAAGGDPDKSNRDRNTPLYLAASSGHLEIVQALIGAGADPDKGVNDGSTSLFQASWFGHLDVVEALIGSGAGVDRERSVDGLTPLAIASAYGQLEVAGALLESGADVDAQADDGSTALLRAAEGGCCTMFPTMRHLMVVRLLLEAGADAGLGNDLGNTPLHAATVTLGRPGVKVARELLDAGAGIDARAKDGRTPLIWAAHYGNAAVAGFLVDEGADVGVGDESGATAVESICGCLGDGGPDAEGPAGPDAVRREGGLGSGIPCPEGGCAADGVAEEIEALLS